MSDKLITEIRGLAIAASGSMSLKLANQIEKHIKTECIMAVSKLSHAHNHPVDEATIHAAIEVITKV